MPARFAAFHGHCGSKSSIKCQTFQMPRTTAEIQVGRKMLPGATQLILTGNGSTVMCAAAPQVIHPEGERGGRDRETE